MSYKFFTEGRERVDDNAWSGRQSKLTTDEIILENFLITISEVAEDFMGIRWLLLVGCIGNHSVAASIVDGAFAKITKSIYRKAT